MNLVFNQCNHNNTKALLGGCGLEWKRMYNQYHTLFTRQRDIYKTPNKRIQLNKQKQIHRKKEKQNKLDQQTKYEDYTNGYAYDT